MTDGKLLPNFRYYYDGLDVKPLIGGKLHSFKASDHSESGRKPLYTDANCTVPYPNPMIADALGCFPDPSFGQKIYWKTDELYYLRLEDANGNVIVDPDNFPDAQDTPDYEEKVFTNYINNGEFFYHKQPYFYTSQLPANTDNYIADSGWIFKRNNISAEIYVEFKEFTLGQTDVPFNPKYYLHFECTSVGAGGEMRKDFLQPISDVATFAGEKISFQLWGKSSLNNSIQFVAIQHFGTGGTPSADVVSLFSLPLHTDFEEHQLLDITLPSVAGKTLGTNNDDKLWIGLRMPLNLISNVDITLLQLNLGEKVLQYDNKTPEIEAATKRTFELPDPPQMILIPDWFEHVGGTQIGMSLDYMNYGSDVLAYDFLTKKYKLKSPTPPGMTAIGWSEEEKMYAENGWISIITKTWLTTVWFRRLYSVLGMKYTVTDNSLNWYAHDLVSNVLQVSDYVVGAINEGFVDHGTGFTFSTIQTGDPSHTHVEQITCTDTSLLKGGEYFTFGTVGGPKFIVYVVMNGNTTPPLISIYEEACLILNKGMTAAQVASTLYTYVFSPLIFQMPSYTGVFLRSWANGSGNDPDRASRLARADGVVGDHVGTHQDMQVQWHNHSMSQRTETKVKHDDNLIVHSPAPSDEGAPDTTPTGYTGGNETRPINVYVNLFIKY